jgi:hypothetical protein
MPEKALRNDGLTIPCLLCQQPFRPLGRRRYCADRCRQAAWRGRHAQPPPSMPARTPQHSTVYECGRCESRQVGEQWCHDCQYPCRRIGLGGLCPHCDEPVTLTDLWPQGTKGGAV